ncbi:MAG TPA: hypothetical protein VFK69_04810 [Candidatus Eisenbacteria bacterium]|nr:hypothetical protein [Candidatus Eisenbacteria bacterium]
MKRRTLLLLLTAALAFAVPARADVFLLGFTGFDFENPNLVGAPGDGSSANYLNPSPPAPPPGEGYEMVGFVTSFNPTLFYADTTVNEYTIDLFGLTASLKAYTPPVLDVLCNPGRVRYFEDAKSGGTHGDYGTFPPNATAPSTFDDGTLALGGGVSNFELEYDYSTNQGDFVGNVNLDEGAYLFYVPVSQRNGWILGGLSGNEHELAGPPNPNIPAGYNHQVSGQCNRPDATPAHSATWGAIKALYR